MKISKKEDYGLILMSILARKYSKDYIALSEIAKETGLSSLFLKHMASKLLADNLIDSKEGIKGGYRLSKSPHKINVAQIMGAMSEGMIIPSCTRHDCIMRRDTCRCFSLWYDVNREVHKYLKKITLDDFSRK